MPIPTDSAERVLRLRTLTHHAERAARGLARGALEVQLAGAEPLGLGSTEAFRLLGAHDWDVDAAFASYKANRPPTPPPPPSDD